MMSDFHRVFGVRHHGPGSARATLTALQAYRPDCVLIEGPADATPLISWVGHDDLKPPVALLLYRPEQPSRAGFFPFTEFSAEFQAINYAVAQAIEVRFCDLPQAARLADNGITTTPPDMAPLQQLAVAEGYSSYDAWWHHLVERRVRASDAADLFAGIIELMTLLRQTTPSPADALLREAYMRQQLRRAWSDGYERVAIVCGAWHTPALANMRALPDRSVDAQLLADLPDCEIDGAWIPYTYSRLSAWSGYGAGLVSPGWYHHLWTVGQQEANSSEVAGRWLTRVAQLLRAEGFDATPAHVIEAVRLAESLAALRGLPFAGLTELNEATQTIMCMGDDGPLRLIERKLIIGERVGQVPSTAPQTPLQRDVAQRRERLALPLSAESHNLNLDLRQPRDLARSHLIHQLALLDVGWGKKLPTRRQTGTYTERWRLLWQPEHEIRLVSRSSYGNSLPDAAAAYANEQAAKTTEVAELTQLLDRLILADLPDCVATVLTQIDEQASLSSDMPQLMTALPPLVRILRYGSVRPIDRSIVQTVIDRLLTRVCIGLPTTCAALGDEAAAEMADHLTQTQAIVLTLDQADHKTRWFDTLWKIGRSKPLHGLIAGKTTRLLLDSREIDSEATALIMRQRLSMPAGAHQALDGVLQRAFWLEGFLKDGGLAVLHDGSLWRALDGWVLGLEGEQFEAILPLLRRTFASYSSASRRQLQEKVARSERAARLEETAEPFDTARAAQIFEQFGRIFGPST